MQAHPRSASAKQAPRSRSGFSLIEFLVIVAIVGALLALMSVMFSSGIRFATEFESRIAAAKKRVLRSGAQHSALAHRGKPIAERYIIILRDDLDPIHEGQRLQQYASLQIFEYYSNAFKGFAAHVAPASLPTLAADPAVRYIEQDQTLILAAAARQPILQNGLRRINAENAAPATVNADIAIIDTGVDPANTNLNVVFEKGFGYANGRDTDGHGTQVACVAAARANETGTRGVAPGARIWALKVAQENGSGAASNLIAALDFAVANAAHIDVVNVGVLTTTSSYSVNLAAKRCVDSGLFVVVAAGNGKSNVSTVSPASEASVVTVAALADSDGQLGGYGKDTSTGDADDTVASFSNFGTAVDFLAPGSGIYAVDLGSQLSKVDGTSYAAAHVAGVAALLASDARCRHNALCDSVYQRPTPDAIQKWLQARVREHIPGPGRQLPYPVLNASFAHAQVASAGQAQATTSAPSLPLSYEINWGQTHPEVRYLTRADGYTAFLTAQGLALSFDDGNTQRMQFALANPTPQIQGHWQLPGIVNYFVGSDPTRWRTTIPTFSAVSYGEIYRGIDVIFYSDQRRVRYDIVVAPGADPSQITLSFPDAKALDVDLGGRLTVSASGAKPDLLQSAPVIYQEGASGRVMVRGRYVVVGTNQVRFEIGDYDRSRRLIIDPYLAATYTGGSVVDRIHGVATDAAGNVYVAGQSTSPDFPFVSGFQSSKAASSDVVVVKYNSAGTALLYSTYVGGPANDVGNDIAVDAGGNAYVTGTITGAPVVPVGAFPTTPGSFENAAWATQNICVFKLNAAGNALVWSAIPNTGPGVESGEGIAVDAAGNTYITGYCTDATHSMIATPGAYQTKSNGGMDAYVMKINPIGSAQIYLTYLGGASSDTGRDIAVDAAGNAYITGETRSTDFPVTSGAYAGGNDAFVAKFDPAGANLLYSTFLGGSGTDDGRGIAIDAAGNAYVTGIAAGGFPVTPGAFQVGFQGGASDAFVAKVNAAGTGLLYSTYLGSPALDEGNDVVIDGVGVAYVTGETRSNLFPNLNPVQLPWPSGADAFVAGVNPAGTGLTFATHVGGSSTEVGHALALDGAGGIWLGGETNSANFPTLTPIQPTLGGSTDAFLAKLTPGGALVPGVTVTPSGGSTIVTEGGATDTYTVVLNSPPFFNVNIAISAGTQVSAAPTTLSFTPANWNVPQTVTVTAVDDFVAEGPHSATITHTAASSDANYSGISVSSVAVSIVDNDSVGVVITQSSGSTDVTEGGANDTYTIVLQSAPTANVTMTINPGPQLNVSPASWTFTPGNWNVPRTITVSAVNDAVAEGPHTGTITHTAASTDLAYNAIAITNVVANITDNNTSGVFVVEVGGFTVVSESGGNNLYNVYLKSAPSADVTITANPGTQLTVSLTTMTFTSSNWNVPQTVTVGAVDDAVVEGTHSGTITHTAVSADPAYNAISVNSVTATINDNDSAGVVITQTGGTAVVEGGATDTYTAVLTSSPTANVTITVNPGTQVTTAPASLTFTSANWNVPQTVTVTAVDDSVVEGIHSGLITHTAASTDANYNAITISNVNVSITDNDTAGVIVTQTGTGTDVAEGGAGDTYTVVLNSSPTANVTININPGTQAAVTPASLTFTSANWNVPQTVTVSAVDDAVVEGVHTGTITHNAVSTDTRYNGITIANVVANITDNDVAGIIVTESGGATNVSEGGPTDTYTLVLASAPTSNVNITITSGPQLTAAPTSLTFNAGNWSTPQTVTVTAIDDAVAEGPHSGTITHTASSGDAKYNAVPIAPVTASIIDNDSAGVIITESSGATAVGEGSPNDTYTVVLKSAPTANVTVTITPDAQLSVSPTSLVFTSANWNTPRTVTVSAVDDTVIEGPHTGTLTHSVASTDPIYDKMTVSGITATITDNDFLVGVSVMWDPLESTCRHASLSIL